MDINALNAYKDYISSANEQSRNKISKVTEQVSGDATKEELLDACKQFEAYFLEQVFKGMEKTIPKNEMHDASTENLVDYFKSTAIQKVAEESTENKGLGLAEQLYEQMKRNYGIES